jgi:hypothetical protein
VLHVRRATAIASDDRPAVSARTASVTAAGDQHRLDCQNETFAQQHATTWLTFVRDVWIFVHRAPDAMAKVAARDSIAGCPANDLDRV